ncbi:high frequency lysogenization protein HflD [Candidatus Halobeggiatoa sp. HSG11]|nr:high frequency lysogenization protein HflD [Candidatus Halobeggiatoa sp. HSG11]
MTNTNIENRILSLAGMFQAAELVQQISQKGLFDQTSFETSINSLLKLDADSVTDVYGGISQLRTGLQALAEQLGGERKNMETMHYVLGMVLLERKLIKQPEMIKHIQEEIQTAKVEIEEHSINHPEILNNLATIYVETISKFDYRIKINGDKYFLENQSYVDKIRVLLLAGIRSAVLWQQKGGRKWQFIFSRQKTVRTARYLLNNLSANDD